MMWRVQQIPPSQHACPTLKLEHFWAEISFEKHTLEVILADLIQEARTYMI